jgi:hypothetical protein
LRLVGERHVGAKPHRFAARAAALGAPALVEDDDGTRRTPAGGQQPGGQQPGGQ